MNALPLAPRVLLVDDSDAERLHIASTLRQLGARTLEARHGRDALAVLRQQSVDVVISDWFMPEMDGLGLCRELRDIDPDDRPYVILLTGASAMDSLVQGLEAGADAFVSKPAAAAELGARLQAGLRARGRERRLSATRRQDRIRLERFERELNDAADLQAELLPAAANLPADLHADWMFRPSLRVGGDGLNIIPLAADRVAFYLFDVCGHGLRAAMHAVNLQQRLTTGPEGILCDASGRMRPPAPVMRQLNAHCLAVLPGTLVTMIYGELEISSGRIRYCRAGHPYPLHLDAQGQGDWLEEGDVLLGALPDARFVEHELTLEPGGSLLLYSDGLIENGPRAELRDRNEQLRQRLARAGRGSPKPVLATVREFIAEAVLSGEPDDVCALALGPVGIA